MWKIFHSRKENMKAVIYARSKSKSDISSQIEMCKFGLQSNSYELVSIITDQGVSGTSLNRDGLQKLLAMCENKEVDVVLACDVTRISRLVKDYNYIEEKFKSCGVKLTFINRPLPIMERDYAD